MLKTNLNLNIPQNRSKIYEGVIQYFGDIELCKIPSDKLSMYCAEAPCLLSEKRYVFVICPQDNNPYGYVTLLSNLNWVSFQTRTSITEHNVPKMPYYINPNLPFGNSLIVKTNETDEYVYYKLDKFPLEIQLINDQKYEEKRTLRNALETYNCNLYFK